jgi:hypothetical protein
MPKPKPEPRKPGRPILPKDEAKGKIVPVRFTGAEYDRVAKAARKADQTVSQWIRTTISEATQ